MSTTERVEWRVALQWLAELFDHVKYLCYSSAPTNVESAEVLECFIHQEQPVADECSYILFYHIVKMTLHFHIAQATQNSTAAQQMRVIVAPIAASFASLDIEQHLSGMWLIL